MNFKYKILLTCLFLNGYDRLEKQEMYPIVVHPKPVVQEEIQG